MMKTIIFDFKSQIQTTDNRGFQHNFRFELSSWISLLKSVIDCV